MSIVARTAVATSSDAKRIICRLAWPDRFSMTMPAVENASTFSGTIRENSARSAHRGLKVAAILLPVRFQSILVSHDELRLLKNTRRAAMVLDMHQPTRPRVPARRPPDRRLSSDLATSFGIGCKRSFNSTRIVE
jgi:hypothetical protein